MFGDGGGSGVRWEVLDVFSMANQSGALRAFFDPWHLRPFVYEEMSVFMLNMLCDQQWEFVRA